VIQKYFLQKPYRVHGLLFVIFIVQGFLYDTPQVIVQGLRGIVSGPDILVTDYIYVGGLGAALVNVGLAGLVTIAALVLAKHEPRGLTMGTLGLVVGFAFFGKNPVNMLPIIAGGFLYAKITKTPSGKCILPAILGTCLAPAVTQLAHSSNHLPMWAGVLLGIGIGLFIGFIMNPIAAAVHKTHEGNNLYNVGFAAGLLGLCLFALFRLLGVDFAILGLWSSGYNVQLTIFLAVISAYFILCGALSKVSHENGAVSLRQIVFPNVDDNDFFREYREKSYINMGVMGLACLLFMLVTRGEYSGPVIGAILSVVGFGAFGKALPAAASIVTGAMLAATVSWSITGVPINDRSFLVAAIFSTCLSPLAKRFGVKWGIVAGFLHLSLATNIAAFHGGMNLYNNGFAGGLAAMMLLPIIMFFRRKECR